MNRMIKDLNVILDDRCQKIFSQSIKELTQIEAMMATAQELIPLDFFLDYLDLVSRFLDSYHNKVLQKKGISYVTLSNRLKSLDEMAAVLRKKDDRICQMIGEKLKSTYLKLSEITKSVTIRNLT